MNKSKLSVLSLTCGIITTTMATLLFPIVLVSKPGSGIVLAAFLAVFTIIVGIIGIVTSCIKLLITGNEIVKDQEDRFIAIKGFWLSFIPTLTIMVSAFLISLMVITSF